MDLAPVISDLPGALWSIAFADATTGATIAEYQPDELLPSASVGKLLLLAALAERLEDDPALAAHTLDRSHLEAVGDSGLWQHLGTTSITVADAATLVFAVSDNLASNALTAFLGHDDIRSARHRFGFAQTDLLDFVRDHREPGHPPTLSVATTAELCGFMTAIHQHQLISAHASQWLRDGLALNVDLSLIPHHLGLDPLSHHNPQAAPGVANKTGTDPGILADTGLIDIDNRVIAYGAICNLVDAPLFANDPHQATRLARHSMQDLGRHLLGL